MTTRAREVEARLREWAANAERHPYSNAGPELTEAADTISALIAECETAKAELAEGVKLMEPFAGMYSTALDPDPDRTRACLCIPVIGNFEYITLGDLRAARAFIAKHTPPQPVPVGEEKGETK